MEIPVNPNARALIFDIDGTLADTMPLHFIAWSQTLKSHGLDYPKSMFLELAGMPTNKIVTVINERFELNLDPEAVAREKEKAFMKNIHLVTPIRPVADIVYRYYNKLPMSLGTGNYRDIAEKTIQTIGMEKYFTALVSFEEVVNPKPAPDTFIQCAKLMGVAPEHCQVFEDGDLGMEAAHAAGMIATDVRPFLEDGDGR